MNSFGENISSHTSQVIPVATTRYCGLWLDRLVLLSILFWLVPWRLFTDTDDKGDLFTELLLD